jgi:hypothetical protein
VLGWDDSENLVGLTGNSARADLLPGSWSDPVSTCGDDGAGAALGTVLSVVFSSSDGWDSDIWTIPGGNLTVFFINRNVLYSNLSGNAREAKS